MVIIVIQIKFFSFSLSLFAFAESVVKKLYDSQVFIGDPDWKLWPGFILDTRTGLILPYY